MIPRSLARSTIKAGGTPMNTDEYSQLHACTNDVNSTGDETHVIEPPKLSYQNPTKANNLSYGQRKSSKSLIIGEYSLGVYHVQEASLNGSRAVYDGYTSAVRCSVFHSSLEVEEGVRRSSNDLKTGNEKISIELGNVGRSLSLSRLHCWSPKDPTHS